jgi:transposase
LIYRRFRRWSACGVWESAAIALAETMAESGHYSIDSTTVRAHVSAAGRKGGFINELVAGRGAGFTGKVHCLGDAGGRPIAFHLTPGEAADCKLYDTLIDLPEPAPGSSTRAITLRRNTLDHSPNAPPRP